MSENTLSRSYRMIIAESLNEAGDSARPSDDRVGSLHSGVWAIDGSTAFDVPSGFEDFNVSWYVGVVEAVVRQAVLAGLGSREAMAAASRQVAMELSDAGYPADAVVPSCAIVILTIAEGFVEWSLLGDVVFILKSDAREITVVSDFSLEAREEEIIAVKASSSPKQYREWGQHRRERDMNKNGGYWVLASDAEAVEHAISGRAPADGAEFLLCTDGFSRVVDTFEICQSWDTLLPDEPSRDYLRSLATKLRAAEELDPRCEIYPRLKQSDDAAAIRGRIVRDD